MVDTLDDLVLLSSNFGGIRVIWQIWEATTVFLV